MRRKWRLRTSSRTSPSRHEVPQDRADRLPDHALGGTRSTDPGPRSGTHPAADEAHQGISRIVIWDVSVARMDEID